MKPAPFDYLAPQDLEEALAALRRHGLDAKILAGGQSLVPLLNLRLTKPKILVDLNGVSGLDHIRETSAGLRIGAMTRQSGVERSAIVREKCPVLAEAIRHIGHLAIRHRGTIGGSLVHADPAAELPAVALALDAKFEVLGDGMARAVCADEFFIDYLTTSLRPDEILGEIIFPVLQPSSGYAVEEVARRHGDFAVAGVVAVVDLDGEGKIIGPRVALFGVAPTAVRARAVEQAMIGQQPGNELIRDAAALLRDMLDPPGDIRASSAYRKRAAAVLTARALTKAVQLCHTRRLS
ncbi:MAG: xanthine dehydrogenase family protein subunit M [Deltaproteobacteria bacterium]|nr:xanthine dehydrogenase family protein subunit M [Deltaproteobacteria bacterium]